MSSHHLPRYRGKSSLWMHLANIVATITLACFPLLAQGPTTGSISGTVTDPSGAVVPDAKVTITSPALISPQSLLSTASGTYRFPSVPVGVYTVAVEAVGFAPTEVKEINITAGFSATIDVPLGLAGQVQSVSVTAEAALLDTENTKVTNTFSQAVMTNLPTARDMWSLAGVAPGMAVTRFDVGGSTMGTQTGYTSYGVSGQQRVQMDGVNMTEGNSATSAYTDYSAFEEITMGTSQNDASMPSPGAQVNMVVKSGGNQFHGDFYQDYENADFQGDNVSLDLKKKGVGEGTRITRYNDTNGTFGGPIKKDKLWFFTSVRHQYIGTTITGYPANDPGSLPFNTTLDNATYKVTYQINSNNKISQFWNMERKQQPYRGASNTTYGDAVYKQNFPQWIAGVEWNSTLSPNAFLNVRLGSWGYNWTNRAYADPATGEIGVRRTDNTSGNTAGGYNPDSFYRRRFQIEPTFSYSMGPHFLTFGFLTEKESYYYEQLGNLGSYTLNFASPAGAPDFTTPNQVTLQSSPSNRNTFLRHTGAYAQDKWKISKHITINYGLRWDYYHQWYPETPIRSDAPFRGFFYAGQPLPNGYSLPATYPDFVIPGNDDVLTYNAAFAPRVGMAWDLFGNGRTSIKIGYGRYYSNTSTSIAENTNPARQLTSTFVWNDANGDKQFTLNELGAFRSGTAGANLATVDPNIKHPYMDDFSGFVEHNITRGIIFRGGFVYRKSARNWVNMETARVTSLYTLPRQINDPGVDGTLTNNFFTVWDIPGTPPASQTQYQTPDWNNTYNRSLEFTVTKRMSNNWMLSGSYLSTWGNNINSAAAQNPNILWRNGYSTLDSNFRIYGTYNAKWGIVITPMLRYQLGTQQGRQVAATGLSVGNTNIPVEDYNAYRTDNVTIFDTRVEKQFVFKDRYKVGVFFDAFNINNSAAAQAMDSVSGTRTATVDGVQYRYSRFMAPTTIISPRIFRLGGKFSF